MNNPFRRNKDNSTLPAEIQEYYQGERRERTGVAWLLALGTLIITVGLAALLFFGGRWAYRAIVDNDTNEQVAQTDENTDDQVSQPTDAPAADPTEGEEQTNPSTGTSSTSTSTPNAPAETATPQTPSTTNDRQVAGSLTTLPSTGAGNIAAVFTVTTAFGTTAHYAITSRRTKE